MRLSPRRHELALRNERGFSMIVAILVLTASTLLLFAAIDAVTNNVQTTRTDLDQKRALLAADSGLSAYEQQLSVNQNFWTTCPGANGATGVTSTVGATGATVPGATDGGSTESYSYANVPATGTTYTGCSTVNPAASTIEQTAGAVGTFRVKVTGTSQPTAGSARKGISRTLVAQFEPNSFLNYVYFSNFEDEDPQWAPGESAPGVNCAVDAWVPGGRNSACASPSFGAGDAVNGPLHSNDDVGICSPSGSSNSPTFGRRGEVPLDQIQTPNVLAEGSGSSCSGGTFNVYGTQENSALNNYPGTIPLPPDNTQLQLVADGGNAALGSGTLASDCSPTAGCAFDGPTTIVLDGPTSASIPQNRMTVTNGGSTATMNTPFNGVVYVNSSSSCNYTYSPFGTENQLYGGTTLDPTAADTDNAGCGDAVVSATTSQASCPGTTLVSGVCPYTTSLTINAANDIIIASSLTTTTTTTGCATGQSSCPTGTAVLGLIANNNVRVFHPLGATRGTYEAEQSCTTGTYDDTYTNTNGTGSLINPVIDAALFAVNDSFMIDDFDCGADSNSPTKDGAPTQLGTLTINGAVIQNFRGRVAEGNPQISGYTKNYWYDNRLQTLSPPYFLDPVTAGWEVTQVTECDVATSC
jgi:Tfp pilus assembly protein PilX